MMINMMMTMKTVNRMDIVHMDILEILIKSVNHVHLDVLTVKIWIIATNVIKTILLLREKISLIVSQPALLGIIFKLYTLMINVLSSQIPQNLQSLVIRTTTRQ